MSVNVLVIGNGGREHALCWKLSQSPRIGMLYCAPGNGGTQDIAVNIPIGFADIAKLVRFAIKKRIDLTIVGPDVPLELGIVNAFHAEGLRIFGPRRLAAEIEWSKDFAKHLMAESKVPTADFKVFGSYEMAHRYVCEHGVPIVIKANGLAFGKGVYVCRSMEEAEDALQQLMCKRTKYHPHNVVVVEEFVDGRELSIHAFCDGKTSVLAPPAQDHKRIFDGDQGQNTGGMGAVTPVPWVSEETLRDIHKRIVNRTLKALLRERRAFSGLLYPGLMVHGDEVKVLEFNARFGDPETQCYMRLLKTDLLDIVEACIDGTLKELTIEWHPHFAVCVVIASGGYPNRYRIGLPITGIREAERRIPEITVFHAGTQFYGELVTSGGRVLGVTAVGETLKSAIDSAYEAVKFIHFEGMYYRTDIGAKAL